MPPVPATHARRPLIQFSPSLPIRPGVYYRRRPASAAPPIETFVYVTGGVLAFDVMEWHITPEGRLVEHYEELLVAEDGAAFFWHGPLLLEADDE